MRRMMKMGCFCCCHCHHQSKKRWWWWLYKTGGRSDNDNNDGEKVQGSKSSLPCGNGAQMELGLQRLSPVLPMVLPLEYGSNLAGMTMVLASMSGKISPPNVFSEATLAEAEDFSCLPLI